MRVVVSSVLPVDVRQWLGRGTDVVAPERGAMSRPQLLEAVAGADGLVCLLSDRIDEELLGRAPRLRVVGNYAVGTDNIDVRAATRRGVVVANTPDVLTYATADLTMALLCATARRIPEGDALVRSGNWTGWEPGQLLGAEIWGQRLGLIGFGRIGRAVAVRARGFDMRVTYTAPHRAPAAVEAAVPATWLPLEQLLAESDFVSLHCPLDATTRGLIGAAQLAQMKRTAFLINTARGACVDETALAAALEAGTIAGAALDVFVDEPRVPERLRAHPRVVLTPHVGSATAQARARMAELAARAVGAVLAGERPANIVNPEVLEARP